MSEIGINAGSGRPTRFPIRMIPTVAGVRLDAAGSFMPVSDNRQMVGRWVVRRRGRLQERVGAFSYGAGADGSGPPSGASGMTT